MRSVFRVPSWASATAVLWFVLPATPPVARLDQQPPPPSFRTRVDLVRLEVTVLDELRRPVHGLTAADFMVSVNGTRQPVEAASEIIAPAWSVSGPVWASEVAADVTTNALGEPRLWVIVLDDALMPLDPFVMETGRAIARRIVNRLGPSDLAAVVFTYLNQYAQDFTNDRNKLHRAIDFFYPGPRGFPLAGRYSKGTLARALSYLSRYPALRKAVVYVSSGVVVMGRREHASFGLPEMWESADALVATRLPLDLDLGPRDVGSATHAQLSRIPVYGISYLGLVAPTSANRNPEVTDAVAKSGNFVLRTLATNTGGRAITDTNDPLPEIDAIFEENSSWYVLGYRPTYPIADGRYRNFQLRVNQRGVSVWPSSRRFEQPKPDRALKAQAERDALSGLLPVADVPLRVTLVPLARADGSREEAPSTVAVILGTPGGSPVAVDGVESLAVEVRAFDGEGRRALGTVRRQISYLVHADRADPGADVLLSMDLRPGRYSLRMAVASARRGRTGSIYADVTVPDFARDPLSMSGLVIAGPRPQRQVDAGLGVALPLVPTTTRTFSPMDAVDAFVRVYQGGSRPPGQVSMKLAIIDEQGKTVHAATDGIAPGAFVGEPRAADYRVRLPTVSLAPAEYLLRIDAAAGDRTITRHARLTLTAARRTP